MKLAASAQMRALDSAAIKQRGIPSLDLMDRAAEALAEEVLALLPVRPGKARISVLCGAGNNGGDGIAAARLLFLAGCAVRAILVGEYERMTPDALAEAGRLSECGVALEPFDPEDRDQAAWIRSSHIVIDALFGVGLSRPIAPDSPYAAAIRQMNAGRGKIVSADIASGVEADTGRRMGLAVEADKSVAFTLPKIGQFVGEWALLSGEVAVRDIGIPGDLVRELACPIQTVEADFAAAALPRCAPAAAWSIWGCRRSSGRSRRQNASPPCPSPCPRDREAA